MSVGGAPRAGWPEVVALGAFVIGSIVINGYRFGISDQAIHLPFLLRTIDPHFPHFLAGDPGVDALAHHPTLFWEIQALLVG